MGRKKEQEHKTLARWIIDKTNTDHYRAGMLSGWKHPYIDADVMEIVGGRKQLLDQATILENETTDPINHHSRSTTMHNPVLFSAIFPHGQ